MIAETSHHEFAPPAIADQVRFIDGEMRVRFDQPSAATYPLFLACKRLPEYRVEFDEQTFAHTIIAPGRFASMLGMAAPAPELSALPLPDYLETDQREIVRLALDIKRFACWSDCGLGKTPIGLEVARQVTYMTGGRVLIVTLKELVIQWINEAKKFYGDTLRIIVLETREEMRRWCATGQIAPLDVASARAYETTATIAITNYEKFNHKGDDQIVSEIRQLAGIILDESSRLKTGGGKQKWALIKSCRGVPYKLSLTATPAPNELMEFASQASWLEKMRSAEEIIWTFFRRDEKTHRWTVRPHARAAFFEWLSGWSIYMRDPAAYGWKRRTPRPPDPTYIRHEVTITDEQRGYLQEHNTAVASASETGTGSLFVSEYNAIQAVKLSQAAKGFVYAKRGTPGLSGKRIRPINSNKPAVIVDLAADEVSAGLQTIIWTEFDEEALMLGEMLREWHPDVKCEALTGRVKRADRQPIKERFIAGETKVLITRADLMGFGQNLQCCGSMIFSGWSFSYEDFYQAVRRAFRSGQTLSVRVHLPVVAELEGQMLDAIARKAQQHEAAVAEMEQNYIRARGLLVRGEAA